MYMERIFESMILR